MKYQKIDPHLRQVTYNPCVDIGDLRMPGGYWARYAADKDCTDEPVVPRGTYRVFRHTEGNEARLMLTRSGMSVTVLARKTSAGITAEVIGRVAGEEFFIHRDDVPLGTYAEVAEASVSRLAASIASGTIEFNESTHFVFALLVECLEELIELAAEWL